MSILFVFADHDVSKQGRTTSNNYIHFIYTLYNCSPHASLSLGVELYFGGM